MIELLHRADPAAGVGVDKATLRAKVDERIGLVLPSSPGVVRRRRPLVSAAASFAAVAAVVTAFVVLTANPGQEPLPFLTFGSDRLGDLPGIEQVVQLETGGVKSMAVDGDIIWLMEALHRKLNRIGARAGLIEEAYEIDAHVEGVVVGGGYVWLSSYDNGGELLRFNPGTGEVDLTIALGGLPGWSAWFGDSLWISNDRGDLYRISAAGETVSIGTGEVKGLGLGHLWINDPATGLITSLSPDGTLGELVIPTHSGLETMDGWGVRSVTEAGGDLWLMDGDYPFGTNLSIFHPASGELRSFGSITFGLHSMIEFAGSLWLTSHTDHLLIRIDPATGEAHRYPMPGKAGGLIVADGSLWVALHHPGALLRLDPDGGLIEAAEVVADDWNRYPHRLLCTGDGGAGGAPTIILEPFDWIDYGSWSVVQAQLSNEGYRVCANGYLQGEASPAERAADLDEALTEAGIPGPYVLVA
ncbi:MAG TPA: hypothetical protein VLA54_13740, partial [Acidimicrobiia bacterium]|nr:hypothetical protein [Acidimicrobiia bacterium]